MFSLLFTQPLIFLVWAVAFLASLTLHEFSHAWAATLLGDQTAKRMGRLTLNPMSHVDPIGLLCVFLIGFGWGKPVPFNPYNLKWPKWGPVFVAFAGPISNLVMSILAIVVLSWVGPLLGGDNLLVVFLAVCAELNVALLVFNLIPLPPLDGSKALLALLSHPQYQAARIFIETRGPTILLLLIIVDSASGAGVFSGMVGWVFRLVASFAHIQSFF